MSEPARTCDETEPASESVQDLFRAALTAHQTGRIAEAAAGYQQVLACDEANVDALHLLGIVHQQTGDSRTAEILIRQALTLRQDPMIFVNLGLLLQNARRLPEAEDAFRNALDLAPDFADAHNNLGNVLKESRRLAEAENAYRHAIESRPDFAEGHNNLGTVLGEMGRSSEAETAYRQALALNPSLALAHCNLGNLFREMRRLPEAEAAYHRALESQPDFVIAANNLGLLLKDDMRLAEAEDLYRYAFRLVPNFVDARYNLGNLLRESGRLPEAETAYRDALELNPRHAHAQCNLGNVLKHSIRFAAAEAAYCRALELQPDYAEAHYNLGNLYQESHRVPEAVDAYRRAIDLKPDYADACYNRGKLLKEMLRLPEAEAAYRRALDLKTDFADARWNLSLLLLTVGRYAEAWQCYESRYDPNRAETSHAMPDLPYPQWQGESLLGKSLMLWPEQGFGDYIQFVRYAPLLKERGVSRLTVLCNPALKTLFESVTGIDAIVINVASLTAHDYWSFPLSLPLHFGTTVKSIPAALPYLHAEPARVEKWRNRLPARGFKVGLAWRGASAHENDANRSLASLSILAPLWSVPGVVFISLQNDWHEENANSIFTSQPVLQLGSEVQDFADTAAIIAQLDLVICVDTAVAHLAGAMGKSCWVLLPATGTDWRWFLDRSDSPWYPDVMRLFRQREAGNWSETLAELALELTMLLSSRQKSKASSAETHVFFVHSPITYSMSMATIAHLRLAEPILIGGRMMSGDNIACTVEDDGIWSIERSCELLRSMGQRIPRDTNVAMYLPHVAFLFGKLIKLSKRVSRIYYLEEGLTSLHAGLLARPQRPTRIDLEQLTRALDADGLIDVWQIDRHALTRLNDMPYSFFDIRCGKYAGAFACLPEAFAGIPTVTRLSLAIDAQRKPVQLMSFASIAHRYCDAVQIEILSVSLRNCEPHDRQRPHDLSAAAETAPARSSRHAGLVL